MTQRATDEEQLIYAEYALGVLEASERARVEQTMQRDPDVAAAVAIWESRLAPLNDDVTPVVPPPHLWYQLLDRLAAHTGQPSTRPRDRVPFWRALALGGWLTGGVAAAALVAVVFLPAGPADPLKGATALAALSQKGGSVQWTAFLNAEQRRLAMVPVPALTIAPDRSAELWLIPPGAAPVSLGVLAVDRPVTVALSQALYGQIVDGAVLAVTLESKGGSPTGAPTGEVLSSGPLRPI